MSERRPLSEGKLDLFARGELPAAESRKLARQALDDPELFDELTYTALASAALARRKPRKIIWPRVAALAAGIVIAVLSLYTYRQSRPIPAAAPAVAVSRPPVFLARSGDSGALFRSVEPESRAPRSAGAVTSTADGIATIDLGSLDGLAKDSEVDVVREGQPIGKLRLTTIFRERARGKAPAGLAVRVADQIRVPGPLYLRAVLDQITALSARGESEAARRMAAQTNQSDAPPNLSGWDDLNNFGGIAELHGRPAEARSFYERALRANPPPEARHVIETNLARSKRAR
jgi:hypothetical protein